MRLARDRRVGVVCALGTAQTVAWAASYYLTAVLAIPATTELHIDPLWFFGGFSLALVLSAIVGPFAGRLVDLHGGRGVLAVSNVVFVCGLVLLSWSAGPVSLLCAWAVMGLGMGLGLYETAFASLTRIYNRAARSPITGITLIAGFASTVGWPISAAIEASFGWRDVCLFWAMAHLALALPLNLLLPYPDTSVDDPVDPPEVRAAPSPLPSGFWILAAVFAAIAFTGTAMAAHLPSLLIASGASTAAAIAAGALVGPAQVVGRLLEFGLLRNIHPMGPARIASLLHPTAAAILLVLGAPFAAVFAIIHGAGNGILTIARGTLPLALFGAGGYGYRSGLLAAPSRIAQAVAPLAFGVLVTTFGAGALWISAVISVAAFAGLSVLAIRTRDAA